MKRHATKFGSIAAAAMLLFFTGCKDDLRPAPSAARSAAFQPYGEPEMVAERLNVPWDLAFAPDGRIYFTERTGAVRVLVGDKLQAEPVFEFAGLPFVSKGEGGLLGLALDPDYANNRFMYVYHTYEESGTTKNRVLRLAVEGNKARLDRVILSDLPGQRNHDGGRIRFGPDRLLYVTVGDAQEPGDSQNPHSLAGKILRIRPDGTIPNDNPDPKSPVYSLGHRNPQGLAWQPGTGVMFASEHGQTFKDEINVIEKGANYGWPLIEGDAGEPKQPLTGGITLRKPLIHSGTDSWAPCGMTFVTQGPWKGELLTANLRGTQVLKLTLGQEATGAGITVKKADTLWKGQFGRLRHVAEGPDGSLYLLTNNRDGRGTPAADDDRIIRLRRM